MPLYVITTKDKPGLLETRVKVRPEHIDYLKDTGVVKIAGPFLNDAGDIVFNATPLGAGVPDGTAVKA